MQIKRFFSLLLIAASLTATAANTKETVSQVTTAVRLTTDVDYVVNGETPFADEGVVDIVNTEHAVLIIERVKPSKVISTLLASRVKINGAAAKNNENCQVRLYGTRGAMILPYASTAKPLTVYSEQNFKGESADNFGLENDGGYMVTMTDKQLNNRVRSFRLKRGYMVTFATQKSGYGYQRCFIANNEDLEMATLPQILDEKISSYRIFKWNTAGKKGLASSTDGSACDALNVISCYGWDTGKNMNPDVECVVNHIYEDYPSSSACGKATWTCHMKTNNEPRNSSDDNPQSLSTILNNWQNLMRTGMRLCSPSSWDGSDYTDGSGFIKQFLDSIDARGWRCDLVDLHCYWLIDNFNNLGTMHSKYKRPLWISEWIWGASWNNNGAFESGKTDGDIAWGVEQIYNKLNSYGYVERYFYWNSETKGKLYDGGSLTQAGKKYANMLSGMGYNKSYEKVPNTPPMRGGYRDFRVETEDGKAVVSWHDYDGEYDQLMEVLRKKPGEAWQTWQTIRPEDTEADYKLTDDQYTDGTRYRLHIRSFSGRDYYSSEDMEPGEAIETENGTRYVGGNVLPNGDFRMGLYGYTNGAGQPLSQPWFGVYPKALTDGYFLQCLGDQGKTSERSLLTAFDVVAGQDYVFRMGGQNAGEYIKVVTRPKGSTDDKQETNRLTLANKTYWTTQQAVFNTESHDEAVLAFRWLAGTAQIGDMELYRLFPTREEAIADGIAMTRKKAQVLMDYNTQLPALNEELKEILDRDFSTESEFYENILFTYTQAISNMQQAMEDKSVVDSLLAVAHAVVGWNFDGREELEAAIETASEAATAEEITMARYELQQVLDDFLPLTEADKQPQSPGLAAADGWETKVGTFTGGDQRLATQDGKTCWNAWWSGIDAAQGESQTMEIRQTVTGLSEGLYALECKGSTQHYCLSDQHGFIRVEDVLETGDAPLSGEATFAVTPYLQRDYLDIPNTVTSWQTMTSTPVYVPEGGSLTIGFTGSKQGAVDDAWRRYGVTYGTANDGDKREGWWCATDFRLLFHPLIKKTVTAKQWGTICLPYAYRSPKGVQIYEIAGLMSDYQSIALQEVEETEPGVAYIYIADQPEVVYYTFGEARKTPSPRGANNLTGFYKSSVNVRVGSYLLRDDGAWHRITEAESPGSYCGYITRAKGMDVLDSWGGVTMPIYGVVDELGEPIDSYVETLNSSRTDARIVYDLQGRRRSADVKGISIKVDDKGNVWKVVR